MKTGAESDCTIVRLDLDITQGLVEISGYYDVDRFDSSREGLVQVFLRYLQFQERTVDLVHNDHRLDTFTESLTKDGLGLDANAFHTIDNNKGTVSHTKSSGDLRREIDVTGGVDQVDQEVVPFNFLRDIFEIILIRHVSIQGDGGGLDSDASILLILARIRKPSFTSFRRRDDTSTLDEGIGKGGLSMVDCTQRTG